MRKKTMLRLRLPTASVLLFLSWLSHVATSQNAVRECGSNLLMLAPCGPFVRGMAATPVQTCCDNLHQLYAQKPTCLCLLLNDTSLASSFPINTTLALRLPLVCNLPIHPSTCSGLGQPPAQISFGANPKAGAAGGISSSPMITVEPRPRLMGFGFPHSAEVRLTVRVGVLMPLMIATFAVLS